MCIIVLSRLFFAIYAQCTSGSEKSTEYLLQVVRLNLTRSNVLGCFFRDSECVLRVMNVEVK